MELGCSFEWSLLTNSEIRCKCINIPLTQLRLGTWAYTTDDLAFKADVETSTLAQSKENFSSSAGWNVLEYRGLQHYPKILNVASGSPFSIPFPTTSFICMTIDWMQIWLPINYSLTFVLISPTSIVSMGEIQKNFRSKMTLISPIRI